MTMPRVALCIFSLPPHEGHVRLNNRTRCFSFTGNFPFVFKRATLQKRSTFNSAQMLFLTNPQQTGWKLTLSWSNPYLLFLAGNKLKNQRNMKLLLTPDHCENLQIKLDVSVRMCQGTSICLIFQEHFVFVVYPAKSALSLPNRKLHQSVFWLDHSDEQLLCYSQKSAQRSKKNNNKNQLINKKDKCAYWAFLLSKKL